MKHVVLKLLLAAAFFSWTGRAFAYNDHRGHNLDSLERVVAPWTPVDIDNASEDDLISLNRAYRDLMLGYNILNSDKSMFYARRALAISAPRAWEEANYDALRYIGQHFYAREQYDSAMVYYRQALSSVQRMADGAVSPTNPEGYSEVDIDDAMSVLYGTIGNLYNMMDSIPLAMQCYEKAGEIFEKHGWDESNSYLYYNIGETWVDQKDFKKAAEAYDRALSYAQASGDSLIMVDVYKGFGRMYMESGRTWKALPYLRQAEDYYSRHPDESGFRTENLEFMGEVLSRQKRQLAWSIAGGVLLLLLLAGGWVLLRRLHRTEKEQEETAALMDETLNELRPGGEGIELTEREKEVLDLLSKGYTAPQIAEAVNLSYETIRWYRKKLIAKFDVSNTPELISRAKELGMI